jgi:hypothetical protein
MTGSNNADAAKGVLAMLQSQDSKDAFRAKGLDPA